MKRISVLILVFNIAFIGAVHSQNTEKEDRAVLLYEQKRLDEAKILFEEIRKEEPNNANVQEYIANIAFDKEDYEVAATEIKILLDKYPNEARYHFKYAGAIGLYAKNNKMKSIFLIDDIKKHFHKAVDLDNSFVDAHLGLVHLYLELPSIFGGSKEKASYYADQVKALDARAGMEAMKLLANAK